jgi:hypothetical protein
VKTTDAPDLEGTLMRPTLDTPPPPPSPAMLKALQTMKPVRTRGIWPVVTLLRYPLRRDLSALPAAWVALGAALWSVALVLTLGAALIPAQGDVLPSAGRASRVGVIAMGVLLLFAALWTAEAPGVSLRPEDIGKTLLQSCYGCGQFVLESAVAFIGVSFLVLRRVLPVGGRRIGLAVGAAGGAMAGLVLHFHCPVATTGHVLLSHAGAVVLSAGAGALILRGLLGR